MLLYNSYWHDIQEQDWPELGMIYVCLDPQKRLGSETWVVSVMGDGTFEGDTVQRGLFWNRDDAVLFAESLEQALEGGGNDR